MEPTLNRPTLSDLRAVSDLCQRAGLAILELYAQNSTLPEARLKSDWTPVTEADLRSNELLEEGLAAMTPGIPVISEEGGRRNAGGDSGISLSGLRWVVDPLDGTKEFLKRTGEFTVNVALVNDSRVLAGVVHAPVLKRSWFGAIDGALHVSPGEKRVIRTRPADPSRLSIVASRDHIGPRLEAFVKGNPGAETVRIGSSLKFCWLAEGRADVYLRDAPTMEWDTAAAQAVLEAAGGGVFDLRSEPLTYGKPGLRNPWFLAVGDPSLDWQKLVPAAEETAR